MKKEIGFNYDTDWICYYENKAIFKFTYTKFHSAAVIKAATILVQQFSAHLGKKEFIPALMVVRKSS